MQSPEIRDFLLSAEALQTHVHQVWAGNQPIIQANGTHPRVRQMEIKDANQFAGLTDKTTLYEVRIIRADNLVPFVRYDVRWELSFNGGVSRVPCKCLQVLSHPAGQEVGWMVILER